ncbi:serine/threonine-protein kinase HipA [Curtobacterium sp. PhB130]|uniref:type II toxin-antitoxin system HipA family toxin n=1 Tax=Curtobacterium sp. PhB130 TaxID=2485178 RepID=UPI000F4B6104|nr:type II toxin-antitoxin system HipA family toxin [Curtobacterium sp. PhB130]ROS77786.1 serine/threonine-protein kinase HipA [Curtobacterium sp. PhB130]
MTGRDEVEVHIELDDTTVFVGRAQFQRSRGRLQGTTFQYETDYLARPTSYAVDPAFRLTSGTQYTPGLPGAFSDSAPDRWGRNLIQKQERARAGLESRASRTLDDVDYLLRVSDATRHGALRFRTEAGGAFLDPGHDVPKLVHLPELLRAADVASGDTEDYMAVKALLDAGTGSLGGARPKASVLGDDGRALIAKFPHHADAWDVMAWEATALDLASAAGVTVALHHLSRVDGRHLLLLERFDRAKRRRIGYLSAMTVLEQRDGQTSDYGDIVERLPEMSSRPSSDARELFRRAAVSVGLNNTDDHLRNHGFLRDRGGWALSPAFDLNPNPDTAARQTTIVGTDHGRSQAEGLIAFAELCRLSPTQARAELTVIVGALDRWRDVAAANGVRSSDLTRFEHSFVEGLATLRAAAN